MAPRGVKRAAEKAAGALAKRLSKQCDEVVAAIAMSDELPESCNEMVVNVAKGCLPIYAADRHAYQMQGLRMVEETLAGVQKKLQGTVAEFQAKVDHEASEKAARSQAAETAKQNLAALERKVSEDSEAADASKEGVVSAQEKLATAATDHESKEAEVVTLSAKKAKLETAISSSYELLKASGSKSNLRQLNALQAALHEVGLEAGLIDSLPETLRKTPEERGTFDGLVQKHVEAGAAKCMAELEQAINAAELAKPKLAEGKAAAEAALTASQEATAASSTALEAAEAALKEGNQALKAAQHAVANFAKEAASASKGHQAAKTALDSFLNGALKAFTELKDLAPAPLEPEEPVAEETPAAEAETAAPALSA